jgi:hypothetical protein
MTHLKIVGLVVAAVLAIGAVFAASASAALPEYRTCIKAKIKGTGTFSDKLCSVPSKGGNKEGGYELGEWNQGKKVTFTGKASVTRFTAYIPENEAEPWKGGTPIGDIECKSGKIAGEITGPKTSTETITYSSCKNNEGKKCSSPGEKAGTIKTLPHLDTLVYGIFGGKKPKKLLLTSVAESIDCEGIAVMISVSALGEISGDVNAISKSSVESLSVNAAGGQEEVFCEGSPDGNPGPFYLTAEIAGTTLPMGETTTASLKGEAMMIQA